MKISFHSYANKTNFHTKSFALSLAFIARFWIEKKDMKNKWLECHEDETNKKHVIHERNREESKP